MSQGGHFTMDFVEEEHRQNINMLMQILCIDLQQAYDLYMNAGCNVQAAIHNHTNPQQHMQSQSSNNRGGNRRNGISQHANYHHQLNELHNAFDNDDDDQEYASLPVARGRPYHPQRVQQQCQFDVKFNKFLQFKRKKKTFDKTYRIRREVTSDSISSKIFNKEVKRKVPQTEPYIKQLQKKFLDRRCPIKFGIGSMSESLQNSWKTQLPLALYHLNFDTTQEQQTKSLPKTSNNATKPKKQANKKKKKMCIDITGQNSEQKMIEEVINPLNPRETKQVYQKSSKNQFLKNLLLNERFSKMVNDQYLNYVFDVNNYELEVYFKDYFKKESKGKSFLVVLRVNVMEQIEFVGKVSLDQIMMQTGEKEEGQEKIGRNQENQDQEKIKKIVEELRALRHKVLQAQKQEAHLHKRYALFQKGIYHYDYIKPLTNTEKKKIKEDRELIQQQQQEFLEIQNQIMQQKKAQQNSETQFKGKTSKEQILQKRKNIREKLKKYEAGPDVMMVKLRLPNGKSIVLNVSLQEKIQYLFDFVYSFEEENIGFEAQQQDEVVERIFDIIRPEDRQELSTKTESTLGAFFQDSLMESLIVKQK